MALFAEVQLCAHVIYHIAIMFFFRILLPVSVTKSPILLANGRKNIPGTQEKIFMPINDTSNNCHALWNVISYICLFPCDNAQLFLILLLYRKAKL